MNRRNLFVPALLVLGCLHSIPHAQQTARSPFTEKPYLQLGNPAAHVPTRSLSVMWVAPDAESNWQVEVQAQGARGWYKAGTPQYKRINARTQPPSRVYRCELLNLTPGTTVQYRVLQNGTPVFESTAKTPKARNAPQRFVVMGDCGAATSSQKRVAYHIHRASPDYVMITGDIVYTKGRISEYRDNFWPQYNTEIPSPSKGAPLLRSTLFTAAVGNHDVNAKDLGKYPDGMAYFLYWNQPLNGPVLDAGDLSAPKLTGPAEDRKALLDSAGTAFPRMANFSFDYGDAHWTVLDANPYVKWSDPKLRKWLADDLAKAQGAKWRFVSFHHPGFNSSKAHLADQWMRSVHKIFEDGRVDIVFSGHVHNYQRAYPIKLGATPKDWQVDRRYDGRAVTKPNGILYIVSGAGGAKLYNPEQNEKPETYQNFTVKLISNTHSFTQVDLNGNTATLRQISEEGAELDRFVVTK